MTSWVLMAVVANKSKAGTGLAKTAAAAIYWYCSIIGIARSRLTPFNKVFASNLILAADRTALAQTNCCRSSVKILVNLAVSSSSWETWFSIRSTNVPSAWCCRTLIELGEAAIAIISSVPNIPCIFCCKEFKICDCCAGKYWSCLFQTSSTRWPADANWDNVLNSESVMSPAVTNSTKSPQILASVFVVLANSGAVSGKLSFCGCWDAQLEFKTWIKAVFPTALPPVTVIRKSCRSNSVRSRSSLAVRLAGSAEFWASEASKLIVTSAVAIAFSAASRLARGCGSASSSLGDCCFHHQYPAPAAAKPMSAVSPISEPECCRVSNSQSAAESPIPPIKIGRRKLSVIFSFLWVFSPSLTFAGLASLPIFHRISATSKLGVGRSDFWRSGFAAGCISMSGRAKHSGRQFISKNQRFTAGMLRPYEYICKNEMHPTDFKSK